MEEPQITPRNIPYKINEIISIDDNKFEIINTYSQDYFQQNFEFMQKKYPTYQFIMHEGNLIVVGKPILEATFTDIEEENGPEITEAT